MTWQVGKTWSIPEDRSSWQVAVVRAGMSSLLQHSCLFTLWREHSPLWVKGHPLLGLSGSLDLGLTFQMNCEDHPRVAVVLQRTHLPGGGGATGAPRTSKHWRGCSGCVCGRHPSTTRRSTALRPQAGMVMTTIPHSHSLGYPQAQASAFLQNPGKHWAHH